MPTGSPLAICSSAQFSESVLQSELKAPSRARFRREDEKAYLPEPMIDCLGLSENELDEFMREQRLDAVSAKLRVGDLELGDPDIRPASPVPIFDSAGVRINTRQAVARALMTREYHRLLAFMRERHGSSYQLPVDFRQPKLTRRLFVPVDEYPGLNFVGMVLGPRGLNLKRVEAETGCSVSIRGKGSKFSNRDKSSSQGASMSGSSFVNILVDEQSLPLHVLVSSESEKQLNSACAAIEPLLDPEHPLFELERAKSIETLNIFNGLSSEGQTQASSTGLLAIGGSSSQGANHLAISRPQVTIISDASLASGKGTKRRLDPESELASNRRYGDNFTDADLEFAISNAAGFDTGSVNPGIAQPNQESLRTAIGFCSRCGETGHASADCTADRISREDEVETWRNDKSASAIPPTSDLNKPLVKVPRHPLRQNALTQAQLQRSGFGNT